MKKKILVISISKLDDRQSKDLIRFKWRFGDWDSYQNIWKYLEPIVEVLFFSYNYNLLIQGYIDTNKEIISIIDKNQPDYILLYGMQHFNLSSKTLEYFNKIESKVIGYFVDDATEFNHFSKYLTPYLDVIVTADHIDSISKYESVGAKAIFIPSGVPHDNFYYMKLPYKYDVSFVGINKYGRQESVDYLIEHGVEITTFGEGWENGKISIDSLNRVYNQSKININFAKTSSGKTHMKWRTFEIPLAGGFMLTEYVDGIENYFEIDKEIVCFRTLEEALLKIKYYLDHDDEREKIKLAGLKRAEQNYTWEACFETIFNIIENSQQIINPKPDVLQDSTYYTVRLGMRVVYAMIFYLEIGNTYHYKEMLNIIKQEGNKNIKSIIVVSIMRYLPYPIGKVLIRNIYDLYFSFRKLRIKNKIKI